MWVEPVDATTTRVERRLLLAPDRSPAVSQAIIESHRLVHQQDVDICARVQRSQAARVERGDRRDAGARHRRHNCDFQRDVRRAAEYAAEKTGR